MKRGSDAPAFGPTATVMGEWGDVSNKSDFEARHLQGADGSFTAGAGSTNQYLDLTHALFECPTGCSFSCSLSSEGGALTSTLEATGSSR